MFRALKSLFGRDRALPQSGLRAGMSGRERSTFDHVSAKFAAFR